MLPAINSGFHCTLALRKKFACASEFYLNTPNKNVSLDAIVRAVHLLALALLPPPPPHEHQALPLPAAEHAC